MLKTVKHYLIPNEGNDHRPKLLERHAVIAVLIGVLFIQLFIVGNLLVLQTTNFLAAIFPSVLVDLTNESRAEGHLGMLTEDPLLVEAAQKKANDMATKGYFAHTSPEGVTPWYWFSSVGYTFQAAGENLAVDFYDSADVHNAWMNSPGHRANILKENFTEVGIATAQGTYQGRPATFIVELFGRPLRKDRLALLETPTAPVPAVTEEEIAPEPTEERVPLPDEETAPVLDASLEEQDVTVVENTDTFIEVQAAGPSPETTILGEEVSRPAETAAAHASFITRFLSMPGTIAFYVLSVLSLLAFLILTLNIVIKWRVQHKDLIVNSIILVIVVITLVALNYSFLFLSGAIV